MFSQRAMRRISAPYAAALIPPAAKGPGAHSRVKPSQMALSSISISGTQGRRLAAVCAGASCQRATRKMRRRQRAACNATDLGAVGCRLDPASMHRPLKEVETEAEMQLV